VFQLRARGHSGVYRIKLINNRLYVPMDQIPKVISYFKLDEPTTAEAARSAEGLAANGGELR
jgi:hypothetical protein